MATDFHPARPVRFDHFAELAATTLHAAPNPEHPGTLLISLDGKNYLQVAAQADGNVVFSRYGDNDVEPILKQLDVLLRTRIGPEHERAPIAPTDGPAADGPAHSEFDEIYHLKDRYGLDKMAWKAIELALTDYCHIYEFKDYRAKPNFYPSLVAKFTWARLKAVDLATLRAVHGVGKPTAQRAMRFIEAATRDRPDSPCEGCGEADRVVLAFREDGRFLCDNCRTRAFHGRPLPRQLAESADPVPD